MSRMTSSGVAVTRQKLEYAGWALLRLLTEHGTLAAFRERFFAAGHAHAGVLLVLSLADFVYLGRAGYFVGVTMDARRLQPTVNN